MKRRLNLTVWMLFFLAASACAPDDPEHPCDPESGLYTGCAKVAIGGECTIDPECEGDNTACMGGTCGVCPSNCGGKDCGADGCGGSCGSCGAGWQCNEIQQCEWTGEEGTWGDHDSGLVWQVEPTGGAMSWYSAKSHCANLDLAGHSDWRLPDIGELRSLIRGCPATELGSATCEVEEGGCLVQACDGGVKCDNCSSGDGPADGCFWPDEMQGACSYYRSSSSVADDDDYAWVVDFLFGSVGNYHVDASRHARCVR